MGPQKTGFEGTTRLSDYLPLADGTRLAYDLILPMIDGRPSEQPLPALFKYTPYLRTYTMRSEEKNRLSPVALCSPDHRSLVVMRAAQPHPVRRRGLPAHGLVTG